VVYNLATEQTKAHKNIEVWGITANVNHDYPKRNFVTRLFKAHKFPFFIDLKLKEEILKNSNKIFHLHGGWVPVFSSIANFLKKHNIKHVLTPHGAYNFIAMKRSSLVKKIYFNLFEKKLLKNVYKIHAIGKSEIEGINQIYPNSKSVLLPYGFTSNSTFTTEQKNENFTIGFVGRLDIYTKGLDLLAEAFLKFQKTSPSAELWIIGASEEGDKFFQKFIEENNAQNIKLLGKKFGDDKDKLISKMHVFAHPSRNEGLPSAVLEAASLGVPTVVSEATNVAEYVKDYKAGVAVDNENVEQLVNAFSEIEKEIKMGNISTYEDGANKMLSNVFAWPILVEKYEELYS
jgi:glycosyltransferase involved in cell wall biosynthesis